MVGRTTLSAGVRMGGSFDWSYDDGVIWIIDVNTVRIGS
jgi:hypothetical protein